MIPTGQPGTPLPSSSPFEPEYGTAFRSPSGEEEGGVDFKRYAAAFGRYKFLILGLTALGLLAGVGLTQVVRPLYEAQAAVQIPVSSRLGGGGQASMLRSAPLLDGRGWVELLRSFAVLDDVVRQRKLFLELELPGDSTFFRGFELGEGFVPGQYELRRDAAGTELVLSRPDGVEVERAATTDSLGRSIGLRWQPPAPAPGQVVAFRVRVPRDAAVLLGNELATVLPQDGTLLRMSLRGGDPQATAAVLNAVAQRFVEVAMLLKREKLTTVTDVLRDQLEASRVDLTNAESSLESYKVNTITLPSDRGATPMAAGLQETRDPVRDAFFQLRIDRDAIARDRDAILRALEPRRDSSSIVIALGTIAAVRQSTELSTTLSVLTAKRAEARQLRLAFAATHPPVRQLEREVEELEQRTVPSQARALADNLGQQIADFDQRIAASSREMQQIPTRSTEEARRQRQVDVSNLIYTQLQSAFEQARLAELSAAPDIRLLDLAVPPTRPVRDQLLFILVGGLLGGFGLGMALAILLDRLDKRIRYPEQVTNDLGLQILGALPLVTNRRDGTPEPEPAAQLIESLRAVRTSLVYSHGTAGPFITTITSPGSGDGKSFTALNLAMSFASAGRRTLLIDADNRRGALHRSLDVSRKPGLMDYLHGVATREEVVHHIAVRNIDFIPCGTRMSSAPELLATSTMNQLVMALRTEYQAIIIDSPPLGAGVDPLILASLCGSLVLVLRTGVTDRELAGARLDDLARLPIRVLGAVLNDVKQGGLYRHYSYLPGYRSEDEVIGDPEVVIPQRVLPGKR
jgi:capsular exopolysaccharide synthesis family protein